MLVRFVLYDARVKREKATTSEAANKRSKKRKKPNGIQKNKINDPPGTQNRATKR